MINGGMVQCERVEMGRDKMDERDDDRRKRGNTRRLTAERREETTGLSRVYVCDILYSDWTVRTRKSVTIAGCRTRKLEFDTDDLASSGLVGHVRPTPRTLWGPSRNAGELTGASPWTSATRATARTGGPRAPPGRPPRPAGSPRRGWRRGPPCST